MNSADKDKFDERNYVEKPLLGQLACLSWEIIGLTGEKQTPEAVVRKFRITATDGKRYNTWH